MAKKVYNVSLAIGGSVNSSLGRSVDRVNSKLDGLAKAAKFAAGVAAAAFTASKIEDVISDSAEAAIEFESSMADVAKVVDGLKDKNGKLTKSYEEMSDTILDLSTDIPMTADAISDIVAAAGQAGIAKKELMEFSETAAKMGVAFDTTAEQAGEWEAAWRKSFGLNQKEVTSLADQINYLGNTSTENANKLSDVVSRIGALGKTSGLSAGGIAAIAASMTKVNSEISATGIKNMLVALTSGGSATKKQQNVLKALNLDAKELAETMQVDAQGAILSVLTRIKQLPKAEQAAKLTAYFGKESLSSIAPLLSNLENLKDQFNKVGDASKYSGSMESEYASRAATKANDLLLAQNKIKKAQITLGDNMLPLIGQGAELIGNLSDNVADFAENNGPAFERATHAIKVEMKKLMPVAINTFNKASKGAEKFWDAISPVGNWFLKHPEVISGAIGGIGAAIITYKVVDGVKNVAGSVKLLSLALTANPILFALGAAATAIGAISVAVHEANVRMKEANLAEHFGDISLSLDDLQEVAGHIIKTDNLGKIQEALSAMDDMDAISESISDAVEELDKMNWKVGIGLKLSKDEKESYQEDITSYIADVQELVTQKQYAVNLAVGVLLNSSELEKSNVVGQINNFYDGKGKELAKLGTDLNAAVTDAFKDGLLDMDEAKEITELQSQMAKIQSAVAGSNFDAQMELLNLKYSGADLDPKSFQNLQTEISKQVEEATSDYDEALTLGISNAKVMLEDGAIDTKEYDSMVKNLKEGYLEQIGDIELKASSFQLDTIMSQYDSELGKAIPDFKEKLSDYMSTYFTDDEYADRWNDAPATMLHNLFASDSELFNSNELDKTTRKALEDLFVNLQPSIQKMQELKEQYEEYGVDIPKSISDGLTDAAMLGALVRDTDSVTYLISDTIANNDEYSTIIENCKALGTNIPEAISKAIEENNTIVLAPIANLWSITKSNIIDQFGTGLNASVPISINPIYDSNGKFTAPYSNKYIQSLPGHADGGIFNTPHVAWFAEDGPEAAVPLDGSANAINIWRKAGQLLGLIDKDGYSKVNSLGVGSVSQAYDRLAYAGATNISNSDNSGGFVLHQEIKIYGNASKESIYEGTRMSQDEFNKYYDARKARDKRVNMSKSR